MPPAGNRCAQSCIPDASFRRDAEQSAERSAEQSAERSAERSAEQSAERSAERSAEQSAERSAEQSAERDALRSASRLNDSGRFSPTLSVTTIQRHHSHPHRATRSVMDRPIVLCGLGRIGSHVLDYLHTAGLSVVVIDTVCKPDDPRCTAPDSCRAIVAAGKSSRRPALPGPAASSSSPATICLTSPRP